ncbi:MAG TPA: DNA alkylation repair protein [Cyclobacteriaceae bacterium]|nr:DNA alkylation repair protein [Cyclobacteriaceae bacterium]
MISHHKELLDIVRKKSEKPTQHTFLNSYLGNDHPRYPISMPVLRTIAKEWMKEHHDLSSKDFCALLTSLIQGESSTEKCFAGILMGYATMEQRRFDPKHFDLWLNYLEGWAEIDSLCTGRHLATDIPENWPSWKKVITQFSRSKMIGKRRASLVLLCSPLSQVKDERLTETALKNIDRLKSEKSVLITKAISWLLRSMIKHYPAQVKEYLDNNRESLPKIAVREALMKLKTGKKTKRK